MFTLFSAYFLALSVSLWDQLFAPLVQSPQFLVAVLSLLTPAAIAVLKQPILPEKWHRPVAWLFSVAVGFLTVYSTGQFDTTNLLTSLVVVVIATEASYKLIWKGTYSIGFIEALTNLPIFGGQRKSKQPAVQRRPRDRGNPRA